MGRQYNYFISPEEETTLAKYLFDNGFCILTPTVLQKKNEVILEWTSDKIQVCKKLEQYKEVSKFIYTTYIYKEEWGELKLKPDNHIMWSGSPVIEHLQCKVNMEQNRLLRGRIYLNSTYQEEIDSFTTIYKDYQKIVRAIKKYITYKDYEFDDGRSMRWPSSQGAVDIIKGGCMIGI